MRFPYNPDQPIDWVEGVELETGERRYVPAGAVYIPYAPPHREENLLEAISTGWAAGSTQAQALRGGLLEVIERDALTIFWYNRLAAPTLDWQSMPDCAARTVMERISARGFELLAKDITTDIGIPAVLLLGRLQTPERPVVLCACRADMDLTACMLGAAEELEHVIAGYWRYDAFGIPDETDEPRGLWDFATYYCYSSRTHILDFMYECRCLPLPPETPVPMDSAAVKHIVGQLPAAMVTIHWQ